MAASSKRRSGSGPEWAGVRLRSPVLVGLSVVEEEMLVEALAVALLPLLVGGERVASGSERADDGVEGGEPGAGCDL
jgi:hypothetical protein